MSIEQAANVLRQAIAEIAIPDEIPVAIFLPNEYEDTLLPQMREEAAEDALAVIDRVFSKKVNIKF